jgi:hypothetical protein
MNSRMIAKLQSAETAATNEPRVSESSSREGPMIAEYADCRMLERHAPPDRRLRNRIIVANTLAWIAIIVLIHLIFF